MDRRRVLFISLAGVLGAGLPAESQQTAKVFRVGYVVPAPGPNPVGQAFDRALRDVGLIEGKNVVIERRYMGGREAEYQSVLAQLERIVDVIVVAGPPAALEAKKVVTRVPVVFTAVGDPVEIGLVHSLAKPGGNLTGVTFDASPKIASKRLELLKEVHPSLSRVAALWSSTDPIGVPALRELEGAAPRLQVAVTAFDVRRAEDFDDVFTQIQKDRFDGLLVVGGPVNVVERKRIADFAVSRKLTSISISRDYVTEGGLMSYGPNLADNIGHAAAYVQKILNGARPGDLPVEQPTKFELVINLKTAKVLGLTIPPSMVLRADQVVE